MSGISIPRTTRHHGATGKTLLPTLQVGTPTSLGTIIQVRKKKKYPNRYLIDVLDEYGNSAGPWWFRRDEFTLGHSDE